MKNYFCLVLLACVICLSCQSSYEKQVIPITSMKFVMWDLLKADELYLRILGKDSTAKNRKENIRLYEEVYAMHHLRKGQFDSSYKFYESRPDQFKILIDSLEAFGAREKNRISENPIKVK